MTGYHSNHNDDNNDNVKKQTHLSKAKCKPLAQKVELVDKLIKAYCNYVALYSDLLQRHHKQSQLNSSVNNNSLQLH